MRLASMPTASINSRLRLLRVRTSADISGVETVDAFGCAMKPDEIEDFLIWRSVLHLGTEDRYIAHGVVTRLLTEINPRYANELVAVVRSVALNLTYFVADPGQVQHFGAYSPAPSPIF